jgi:hypothetical protein
MIFLFTFVKLYFFPFLMSRRIPPSGAVYKQILGQPLNGHNLLLILNIKGIEISP